MIKLCRYNNLSVAWTNSDHVLSDKYFSRAQIILIHRSMGTRMFLCNFNKIWNKKLAQIMNTNVLTFSTSFISGAGTKESFVMTF